MKTRAIATGAATAITFFAVCLAVFVWPTVYRYDHMDLNGTVLPVRIHRISGKTEILYPNGWKPAQQEQHDQTPETTTTPAALPQSELGKLEGNAQFFSFARELSCSIYNGTSCRINELIVHVQVTESENGTPLIDRDYRLTNSYFTDPMATGIFSAYVGFSPQQNQKWSWYIKGASGVKQ